MDLQILIRTIAVLLRIIRISCIVLVFGGAFFFSFIDKKISPVTVFFFRNGASNKGVSMSISSKDLEYGWTIFFQRLKTEAPRVVTPQSENENWESFRVFDNNGKNIALMKDLFKYDKQNLYVVPKNRPFYWPYVRLGHRAYIKDSNTGHEMVIVSLNESPRIFYIHNLISHDEADFLVSNAFNIGGNNRLMRSTTGTQLREERDLNDPNMVDSKRTSDNAWDMESPAAVSLFNRMFKILGMPIQGNRKDGLQLVRYKSKQAYKQHYDYYPVESTDFNYNPSTGGSNRFASIVMYLSDVEVGGQTNFPYVDIIEDSLLDQLDAVVAEALSSHKQSSSIISQLMESFAPDSWEKVMVEECYKTFSVKPKKGTSIMFYDLTPAMVPDSLTLNGDCPVLNGTKWGANAWIWNGPKPHTQNEILLTGIFLNAFKQMGTLWWGNTELGILKVGGQININTFNGHQFVFKIADVPVWSHTMDENDGIDQIFVMNKVTGHQEL